MHQSYADIRALTNQEPLWHDANGVPRYAPYHPNMLGIYDQLSALFVVQCQSCEHFFSVGDGTPRLSMLRVALGQSNQLTLHQFVTGWVCGDPPRHDCPGAGETMSAMEIAVLQAWENVDLDWVRRPELERPLIEEASNAR